MNEGKTAWNRDNWPIAAAMINFPGVLPDGSLVQEQSVDQWAQALMQVVDAGFTELDPTDSWLRVADLSPSRLREFQFLVKSLGLTVPAISTSLSASRNRPRRWVRRPVRSWPGCRTRMSTRITIRARCSLIISWTSWGRRPR